MAKATAKGSAKGKSKSRGGARRGTRGSAKGRKASKGKAAAAGRGRAGARAGARAKKRAPSVGSGKGTIGKSGEGLDGGVARRQAGDPAAVGTRRTVSRRPTPKKARAQLPHEKAVRDTDATIPLEPERLAPGQREPVPDVALDRRRQIVGTDDTDSDDTGADDTGADTR